jgi:hypothetical protein
MKFRFHLVHIGDTHVGREHRVEGAMEGRAGPSVWNYHACCLPEGMDSGVSSACAEDGHPGPAKALHRVFEHSLNRPLIGLALPACEVRSVVLNNELQRSRLHSAQLTTDGTDVKADDTDETVVIGVIFFTSVSSVVKVNEWLLELSPRWRRCSRTRVMPMRH